MQFLRNTSKILRLEIIFRKASCFPCGISVRQLYPSTKMPESMDRASLSSTPEPLFMDKCGKNPGLSTKNAVYVDGEIRLSTIKAVPVDKWQKKRLPSTYKPDFVDRTTWSFMKTALSVDDPTGKNPV